MSSELVNIRCCSCGIAFAIDSGLNDYRLKDGKAFYCPNGHEQHYIDSHAKVIKDLKEKLAEVQKELDDYKVENKRLRCELLQAQQKGFFSKLFSAKDDTEATEPTKQQ